MKGVTQTFESYTENRRVDFLAGFELSVLQSRNVIYLSIIAMPE